MKLAAATVALAAALGMPATANAQLPSVPRHAKKMTAQLAYNVTWRRLMEEIHNRDKWPHGMAPTIEAPCEVTSRWRGVCDYRISGSVIDPEGFYTSTRRCEGTVTVRINRRTRRVSSRKTETGCAVTGPRESR